MRVHRLLLSSSFALLAAASVAAAQSGSPATPAGAPAAAQNSLKGTWIGFADTQQGQQRVTFVFDSSATDGWWGAALADGMGRDSLYMDALKVKGDSLGFSLNIQGTAVGFRGARGGNRLNAEVFFNGQSAGTVRLARAGSAELAQLLTPPMDLEDRRR